MRIDAQLLNSHDFKCGEEILTIAAMTQVQVGGLQLVLLVMLTYRMHSSLQRAGRKPRWRKLSAENSLPRKA